MEKREIRKQIIKLRSALEPELWQQYTDAITDKILTHPWFREATDLYCYVDCKAEVGTRKLIAAAWRLGKSVWVPKVQGEEMEFYRLRSFDALVPGSFGLLEPPQMDKASGEDGLVVMPLVAFDRARNRVGYGKGYYDRYLRQHPGLHTMGAAFELQRTEDMIACGAYDIRPKIIVTEEHSYRTEEGESQENV